MFTQRTYRALVLSFVPLLVLVCTTVANGASSTSYKGLTSQHQPISFKISGNKLKKLEYYIVDKCSAGKFLRVHNFNFPALAIINSKIDIKFTIPGATTTIKAKVSGKKVDGSLIDHTKSHTTHKYCNGTANFHLRGK